LDAGQLRGERALDKAPAPVDENKPHFRIHDARCLPNLRESCALADQASKHGDGEQHPHAGRPTSMPVADEWDLRTVQETGAARPSHL
jgi:hypothetical protein